MANQESVNCDIAYKAESTFGTLAGAAGAQTIRRVSSDLALNKAFYESEEVAEHLQTTDGRHGTRQVPGTINGEWSPGTYWDFLEALLRGTDSAAITRSNTEFTSLAATNATKLLTVAASTWAAQGFRVGDRIVVSGASVGANNRAFQIIALSGVDATVSPAPTDMGADTSFSVTTGRKVFPALTRATRVKRSFTIEQNYADVDISDVFTGCRIGRIALGLPATGLSTIGIGVLGQDGQVMTAGAAPYFTTPAAPTTTGIFAAVNGTLAVGGVSYGVITGLDITLDAQPEIVPVVGSNVSPDVFLGKLRVTGNMSFILQDEVIINQFINESTPEVAIHLETADSPAQGVSIFMAKIKFTGTGRDVRNRGPLVIAQPFQALLPAAATGYDQASIVFTDSAAV